MPKEQFVHVQRGSLMKSGVGVSSFTDRHGRPADYGEIKLDIPFECARYGPVTGCQVRSSGE